MTQLDVAYRYVYPPREATMRALDNVLRSTASDGSAFDES